MKHSVILKPGADAPGFRAAVRTLLSAQRAPEQVIWANEAAPNLFDLPAPTDATDAAPVMLSRAAADLIEKVICHRDSEKYALLYALIWRIRHGEPHLLEIKTDPLIGRLESMAKKVRNDIYKMHAFVRFRRTDDAQFQEFVAWFEPEHFVLELAAPFFVDRFPSFRWKILTPVGSIIWDRATLCFGPPAQRCDAPDNDEFELGWADYYQTTFNPARLNSRAMLAQMPKKYWRNMPETKSIPDLIKSAAARVDAMIEQDLAMSAKRNPTKAVERMADQEPASLEALNRIIAASEPFVPGGVRAILGEGPIGADIAFVGEQPGDQEDLQGHPFVGPAGQLLDRAMAEANIDRGQTYVTNAVKHFKFEQRGKRRLHKTPTTSEVKHYRWWLEKELGFVHPRIVVALGATATLALAGKAMPINANRGPTRFGDQPGFITVHPSYMLRLPDAQTRDDAYHAFVQDLKKVAALARRA